MNFWLFSPSFVELTEDRFIDFLKEHGQEPKSECFIPTVVDALIHADRAGVRPSGCLLYTSRCV